MFGNYVNSRDVLWVCTRLPTRVAKLARALTSSGKERTITACTGSGSGDQWWVSPAVERRWNRLISGDPAVSHYAYLAGTHLKRGGLNGLSVGCGEGAREIEWAKTGRFRRLCGVDLTPSRIAAATAAAKAAGLDHVLDFRVGDLADRNLGGDEPFDVVIGEHSIHHLSPLREILLALRDRLAPGGLMLLNEFVGPTRFQWTDVQLAYVEHLLALIPERLRREPDGELKLREYRPSILFMKLKDPSEAVESARIMPLMDELFERVEVRPYGGTILHILLSGIAQNFQDGDAEAMRYLELLAAAEDTLLATGQIPSDFVVAVYRKK